MPDRERRRLIFAHQEWLGFVQPVGLVVSPAVMVDAQVVPDRNVTARQREFTALLERDERDDARATARWRAPDLRRLLLDWLGWEEGDLVAADAHRDRLEIALPELQAVLAPTWAVPADGAGTGDSADADDAARWRMLIRVEPDSAGVDAPDFDTPDLDIPDLDAPPPDAAWNASRHERFVRLLAETGVPVGLLCTADRVRLVHAPRGETPGWLTFDFSQMAMPAGRPILAAFDMLLSAGALFGHEEASLPALLARSREAQAEVSTRLARQVLAALHELLRGFVAADARGGAEALAREDPKRLYNGLVVVLMRLVFLLYTEDRGLMPAHPVYEQYYSLGGLFARLRADAAAHPDTMDQRFGAWAQLLALFRLVHGGGRHGAGLSFAARKGRLFDPARFPFLECLSSAPAAADGLPAGAADLPLAPDGTVWRVLENLMMLDGERLSYRTLDVEQIGSVYEAIMGFRIERTTGRSIAVRSPKRTGAAVVVDLDDLLSQDGGARARAVAERTGVRLPPKAAAALRQAATVEDVVAALEGRIDRDATPDVAPPRTPVLQPTDERRRSGSHYTPSTLTGPIVADALRPVFDRLGPAPAPDRVLDLKVLDPAMGSGAFLVEACRQLAGKLVAAWHAHGGPPPIPPDEDELLHARRLVAQRCLHGVDRNPMAVELARLSLWLVTFAKDHEFTFVDHALRHGDALVGLSLQQIEALHWRNDAPPQRELAEGRVRRRVAAARTLRARIHAAQENASADELGGLLRQAEAEMRRVAVYGDLVLLAFFQGTKPAERERMRREHAAFAASGEAERYCGEIDRRRRAEPPFAPFHWEVEFPEVFERGDPGFDAVVGNPPFAGKNTVAAANAPGYPDWLKQVHAESHGNADQVAHFFRRAFDLLRRDGAFGLIATNTIAQGDTRSTGLRWICEHGGEIYDARRRVKWPGLAAVVVSVLHVRKGCFADMQRSDDDDARLARHSDRVIRAATLVTKSPDDETTPELRQAPDDGAAPDHRIAASAAASFPDVKRLDGEAVETITAFLFHRGGHADPARLTENAGKSFQGSIVLGMGFTFDDTDKKGVASPLAEMRRLIDENPRNREVIFPYVGGEEVNTSPTHAHHRYVINFRDWPLRREDVGESWAEADADRRRELRRRPAVPLDYPEPVAADWPELLAIVEERVKPDRAHLTSNAVGRKRAAFWWQYGSLAKELYSAVTGLKRVLVISRVGQQAAFTFLARDAVYAESMIVFPSDTHAAFCALQSRPHEIWARFFGSSMKDDLRYTPSDCFETFPFPEHWETRPDLEAAGKAYHDFRAALMVRNDEGLTRTYNRFHDPHEHDPEIAQLRDLHAAMDRAVLDAYGWTDVPTDCEFLLDYPIDEEEWGARKKPYRYRWPDPVRDEVLARLLELNAERAEEERLSGAAAAKSGTTHGRPRGRKSAARGGAALAAESRPLLGDGPMSERAGQAAGAETPAAAEPLHRGRLGADG